MRRIKIRPALTIIRKDLNISKRRHKGTDGMITAYAWLMFNKVWMFAISDNKWHAGERFKRTPIWFDNIQGGIPALFVWKLAIGFDNRKPKTEKDVT